MWKKGKIVVLVVLGLFLFLGGCGKKSDDEAEKQAIQQKINVAKTYLSQGKYKDAEDKFLALKEENPKYYKGEIYYGYGVSLMLADINEYVDQIVSLLGAIPSGSLSSPNFYNKILPQLEMRFRTSGASFVNNFIATLIDKLNTWDKPFADVEKVGSLNFKINKLPIQVAGLTVMDLGGEHDMGEVHFIRGVLNILLGWTYFFNSINYYFSITDGKLLSFLTGYLLPKLTAKGGKKIPPVINAVTLLLNDNPTTFLALAPNGVQESQTARAKFQLAYAEFADTIAEIKSEKDSQSDDIIAYEKDSDGNEYAVFNIKDLNLSTSDIGIPGANGKLPAVTVSTTGKLRLNIGNGMEDILRRISDDFKVGGKDISWANDIAPLLSAITVMVLKSGMLNDMLKQAAKTTGGNAGSMIDSLLNSDLLNEDLITGVLTGFIPDFIKLNFGKFYNNPKPIRDLLPVWTDGITTYYNKVTYPTDYFALEYECGDYSYPITDVRGQIGPLLVDSIVCNKTYYDAVKNFESSHGVTNPTAPSLEDKDHFSSNDWIGSKISEGAFSIHPIGIEEYTGFTGDGFEGILPYLYFPDPSLNHLIKIKLAPVIQGGDTSKLKECQDIQVIDQFNEPTADYRGNKCLNYALNKIFSGIINTLGMANHLVISAK